MKTNIHEAKEADFHESVFNKREEQWAHVPYDNELLLLDTFRRGDIEAFEKMIVDFFPIHDSHLSKDPLRQRKYEFVAFIALASRASVEAGVNAEEAYSLSDSYIQAVDEARSQDEVSDIFMKMARDFFGRIIKSKKRPTPSKLIAKCLNFIDANLHYTISLKDLALHVKRTPAYISTRFKKEIGDSVTEYISRQRIEEAKRLLAFTDMPIAEISHTIAFNSQSYFSLVFRKSEGLTPKEYRSYYYRKS